jgi:hypothetical protein
MNNRPHPNPLPLGEGVKTIVITGATGALGSLAAKTFAGLGHNLALLDKDSEKLDSLVRDLNLPANRLSAQTVDLLDAAALQTSAEAVLSKFGSVHACSISSAAGLAAKPSSMLLTTTWSSCSTSTSAPRLTCSKYSPLRCPPMTGDESLSFPLPLSRTRQANLPCTRPPKPRRKIWCFRSPPS